MHSDLFHPEKLLAAGPSAKIYRGVETATGRKVLIKVLLEDHESSYPLDRERLQLLAHSLLHVRHPQIAGMVTMLPTEEEFALVYEFVPGISGRALATEKRLSAADVRALAVQLLHAMMVGEHMRLPHGDLKPSNLIVADHPGGGLFLQVQDWGISMARPHPTPETLWFAAPERLHGASPNSQSDLFSAAASLFYLATGTAPAQGSTPEEILADWGHFDPRGSMYAARQDMDQPLVDWIAWLLQRDPGHRPHSVGHALDVLMRTMHTGFIYQPAPAPQMAPGAVTGPLVAGGQPNAAMPRAAAPRPPQQAPGAQTGALPKQPQATGAIGKPQATGPITKPLPAAPKTPGVMTAPLRSAAPKAGDTTGLGSKTGAMAASAATNEPKKPRLTKKAVVAIALNLAALIFVLSFFHVFESAAPEEAKGGESTESTAAHAQADSAAEKMAAKNSAKAGAPAAEKR